MPATAILDRLLRGGTTLGDVPPAAPRLAIAASRTENRAFGRRGKGGAPVRVALLVWAAVVLAACGDKSAAPPAESAESAAILKKDCADPQWKEENLGLWYSVCRQPMRW